MSPSAGARYGHQNAAAAVNPPVAGYTHWFDMSDAASITASSGAVSQLNDKSGNNNHATQPVAGNKPTTGTVTISSLNTLDFDGGDYLSATANLQQPCTLLVVAKNTVAAAQRNVVSFTSARDGRVFSTSAGLISTFGGTFLNSATSWGTTNPHQVSAILNAGSSLIGADATTASGNAGTNPSSGTGTLQIGAYSASEFWTGPICEIVIYASALNTTDRQLVEAYLKAKWGTP